MMKKRPLLLCIGASLLVAGVVVPNVIFSARVSAGDKNVTEVEVEDDVKLLSNLFNFNNLRAKVSSLAPTSENYSSSEKGLLIYGYESGGVASYKQLLNGSTTFRSIANTKDKLTPNLLHYSYNITEINTNESFKIHVITSDKVTTYYVEADGKIAGESYFSSINGMVTHGYSKLYNNSGTYTKVTSTGANIDSKIIFNPSDMSITVEGQTKNFEVWNFKNDYIDGKGQIKHFDSFKNYKVDIVFEEVLPNSKSELVLYEIGNKKFDSAILSNSTTLFADLSIKGIVNKPYNLPTPMGELKENVEVWVYKDGGDNDPIEVMHNKLNVSNTFTPDTVGDYYILYKTAEGELRDKISVLSSETTTTEFSSNVLDSTSYGYKSTIVVPKLTYKTNRSSNDLKSLVTIKCGDSVIAENREPGFEFSFDHHDKTKVGTTEYTFIYKCENSNITESVSKKVVVDSNNGVLHFKPYLSDYAANSTIEISKGTYYINGQEYVCDAEVIYPAEEKKVQHSRTEFGEKSPELTLDANGSFKIRYHNDEVGANLSTKFRVMPKISELFSGVDATTRYGNSSSSDINHGVIGSFKNDGTITYKNEIDVSTLTKDTKMISLSAQAKVPGTAEMNHIYVTLEDASNPDNYFEIRLSQGSDSVSDKTFIRAMATGQEYGGYYYNSWFDIDSNIAVSRWFKNLEFGQEASISFNKFECHSIVQEVGGVKTMTLKVDHAPKNLHFLQENVTRSSFTNDITEFVNEFDSEISERLMNGRLTKADIGTVHEPEVSWQATSAHDQGGFLHEHSFTAAMDTYSFENVDYVDFYYDNATKAVYTNFWYHVAGYQPESRIVKLCDFDDPNTYGGDKVWDGFKSNKVKLSVRATGISGETGDVFIREICGNRFDGELLGDTDNPIIEIDKTNIPNAKVGTPFRPLDAKCSDLTSAVESKIVEVTDPDGENVPLVDGKFTPTREGSYTLKYTAEDSFGNKSSESVTIYAKNPEYFEPFAASLNVEEGQEIQYGVNYQIPEPDVSGGCGKYSIENSVTVLRTNGQTEKLDVVDGKVKVLYSGIYTVNVKVTDYLGEEINLSYTFTSTFSNKPIFDGKLVTPERLFNGVPYKLDSFTADIFEKEGEEQKTVAVKAKVTDADGTRVLGDDMLYTPKCNASVKTATIQLFVPTISGDVVVDETNVNLFDLANTDYILEGYFINGSNVNAEAYFGNITLMCNDDSGIIDSRFVYPIADDFVSLNFSQYYISGKNKQNKSQLDSFTVTLTDFMNPNISFDIKYTQKSDGVYASLPGNGDVEFKVKNSFTDINLNGDMGFTFKKDTNAIADISGSIVGKISKCSNGNNFNGFTSGKVLVSIHAEGVALENGFYLKKLSNIGLNNSKTDTTAPSLNIKGSYGGYVRENQKVTLPSATAYDVLSYCGTPTLSVFSASTGEYVKDVNGLVMKEVPTDKQYIISFEKYGEYTVEYKASDSAGNVVVANAYPYYVTDVEPATLAFSNELSNDVCETTIFSSINLFEYTVNDNAGSNGCMVNVYVVLPTSEVVTIKTDTKNPDTGEIITTLNDKYKDGKYRFDGKGMYQIIYLVTDSNGNICAITKTVNVTK